MAALFIFYVLNKREKERSKSFSVRNNPLNYLNDRDVIKKAPTSKKVPERYCWFGKRRHLKAYQQKQSHPGCIPSIYHYHLIIKIIRDLNKTLKEYATERFYPIARQTSNSRSQAKSPRRTPNNFYRLGVVVQPHRPVASGVEIYIE